MQPLLSILIVVVVALSAPAVSWHPPHYLKGDLRHVGSCCFYLCNATRASWLSRRSSIHDCGFGFTCVPGERPTRRFDGSENCAGTYCTLALPPCDYASAAGCPVLPAPFCYD